MSHNVGHLVIAAVVHSFHRVENSSLYGLKSVAKVWHGSLQNYITCVIQEPVLIHAAKMVYRCGIKAVTWLIVGVLLRL